VIAAYCSGADDGQEQLKSDAIRWLRGEFSTRTDARAALGVRSIVDDASVYDQLKLMARFVRLAGFGGLLVSLDELVNLYKLANSQARNANYEQLLRMLNDSLQGTAVGLGFVRGGTPEFLMDTRRGVYSYSALQSRLAQNTFAVDGLVDFSGPVVRLSALTAEDFYLLLGKIRHVYASGEAERYCCPTPPSRASWNTEPTESETASSAPPAPRLRPSSICWPCSNRTLVRIGSSCSVRSTSRGIRVATTI
jgi:P-loop Domain of unknown function (DUF2791)